MRLAAYNIEWFANLFDGANQLLRDDAPSGRAGVTRGAQADAAGRVLAAIDADAILITEAPNTGTRQDCAQALKGFAAAYGLRQRRVVTGFASATHQEIALLYDPDKLRARHDPRPPRVDTDLTTPDGQTVRFSKPPLELALSVPGTPTIRLIGVHLKSKAPHGAETPAQAVKIGRTNRRKQAAQAAVLRARLDQHIAANDPVILMGDVNDDLGFDALERDVGTSAADILLGNDLTAGPDLGPTARFDIGQGQVKTARLDYAMISPDLADCAPKWQVWAPEICFDQLRDMDLSTALHLASDHFPVTLDLDLSS